MTAMILARMSVSVSVSWTSSFTKQAAAVMVAIGRITAVQIVDLVHQVAPTCTSISYVVPWHHVSLPSSKRHLDRFNRFCGAFKMFTIAENICSRSLKIVAKQL